MNRPQYLFLTAVGRSGTTIFRRSIGLHPQIYYNGGENNIVQDLLAVGYANSTQKSRINSMAVETKEFRRVFRRSINDLIWPDHELRECPVHFAAINANRNQIKFLKELFPNAKILVLVRNGIEVVSSRTLYDSFKEAEFESHCRTWLRTRSAVAWGRANRSVFRLFRHEWFYDEPKIRLELNSLFSWLNLEPDEKPVQNIINQLQHPTGDEAGSRKQFKNLDQADRIAYFRKKSNRWKDWTDEQRSVFVEHCEHYMKLLGYEIPWLT